MYGSKWDLIYTTLPWKGLVHNLKATCFTISLHPTHPKSSFIIKLFFNLNFILEPIILCDIILDPCRTKRSLPCANMFHCITLMVLLGALLPSLTWVNFLWKRGGLSLRASSHCRSSSTGSDTLCPCNTRHDTKHLFTAGVRLLYTFPVLWAEEMESPDRKLDPGLCRQEGGGPDGMEGGGGESCWGSESGRCTAWWHLHPLDTLFIRKRRRWKKKQNIVYVYNLRAASRWCHFTDDHLSTVIVDLELRLREEGVATTPRLHCLSCTILCSSLPVTEISAF